LRRSVPISLRDNPFDQLMLLLYPFLGY